MSADPVLQETKNHLLLFVVPLLMQRKRCTRSTPIRKQGGLLLVSVPVVVLLHLRHRCKVQGCHLYRARPAKANPLPNPSQQEQILYRRYHVLRKQRRKGYTTVLFKAKYSPPPKQAFKLGKTRKWHRNSLQAILQPRIHPITRKQPQILLQRDTPNGQPNLLPPYQQPTCPPSQ